MPLCFKRLFERLVVSEQSPFCHELKEKVKTFFAMFTEFCIKHCGQKFKDSNVVFGGGWAD